VVHKLPHHVAPFPDRPLALLSLLCKRRSDSHEQFTRKPERRRNNVLIYYQHQMKTLQN
jgi:hypothetical protein